MASLLDLVTDLDAISGEREPGEPPPTIFARRPWTPQSDAVVLREGAVGGVAPSAPEFAYLLELFLVRDVLEVWSAWRGGAVPTPEEATRAIIHYGEHDAYQPVDDDRAGQGAE